MWLDEYTLLKFNRLDSTNDEAIRIAKANYIDNVVIWSEEQFAYREQKGCCRCNTKEYICPKGNLYFSILLSSTELELQKNLEIAFIATSTLYQTVNKLALKTDKDDIISLKKANNRSIDINLRSPNNIFIKDKQIGSTSSESIIVGQKCYIIIGVSLNIKTVPYSTEPNYLATSLSNENIVTNGIDDVLHEFMSEFQKRILPWKMSGKKINGDLTKSTFKGLEHDNFGNLITITNNTKRMSGMFMSLNNYTGT